MYIYLKGLIERKKLFHLLLIIIILMIIIIGIFGYQNILEQKIKVSTSKEDNRTISFKSEDINLTPYSNQIENMDITEDYYTVTFYTYEDLKNFENENKDNINIVINIGTYDAMELFILKVLNIAVIILLILLFLTIIFFNLNYFNSCLNNMKLYYILGFQLNTMNLIYNLFITCIYLLFLLSIYGITLVIKTNLLKTNNIVVLFMIIIISSIITYFLTKKILLKKEIKKF